MGEGVALVFLVGFLQFVGACHWFFLLRFWLAGSSGRLRLRYLQQYGHRTVGKVIGVRSALRRTSPLTWLPGELRELLVLAEVSPLDRIDPVRVTIHVPLVRVANHSQLRVMPQLVTPHTWRCQIGQEIEVAFNPGDITDAVAIQNCYEEPGPVLGIFANWLQFFLTAGVFPCLGLSTFAIIALVVGRGDIAVIGLTIALFVVPFLCLIVRTCVFFSRMPRFLRSGVSAWQQLSMAFSQQHAQLVEPLRYTRFGKNSSLQRTPLPIPEGWISTEAFEFLQVSCPEHSARQLGFSLADGMVSHQLGFVMGKEVAHVEVGGLAYQAGLRDGDVIHSVDGRRFDQLGERELYTTQRDFRSACDLCLQNTLESTSSFELGVARRCRMDSADHHSELPTSLPPLEEENEMVQLIQ